MVLVVTYSLDCFGLGLMRVVLVEDELDLGEGFNIYGLVLLFGVGLVIIFACGLRSLGPSSLCKPDARHMLIEFSLFSVGSIIFVHTCFLFSLVFIPLIFFFFSLKTTITSFDHYLLVLDSFMALY